MNQTGLGGVQPATAKPFLKWVGGKTQLLPQLSQYVPAAYRDYYEPFFGGGALYFYLRPSHQAYVNDINPKLIAAYQHIRDTVEEVLVALRYLEADYHGLDAEGQKTFFYDMRHRFNNAPVGTIENTSLLIFLNKTCFNGMYRENRKGEFNVPFGKHKHPLICNEPNIRAVSAQLQHTHLSSQPFEQTVAAAKKGDLVYFDPPYHPVNETSSFTSYSEAGFTADDQRRLKSVFDDLQQRGCLVMLSNSDTPFIRELYQEYRQVQVYAARSINSVGSKRGKISELLVLSY